MCVYVCANYGKKTEILFYATVSHVSVNILELEKKNVISAEKATENSAWKIRTQNSEVAYNRYTIHNGYIQILMMPRGGGLIDRKRTVCTLSRRLRWI